MQVETAVLLTDVVGEAAHPLKTRAVEPLEVTAEWRTGEVPETFPTGT